MAKDNKLIKNNKKAAKNNGKDKKANLGITASKDENFSEWFTQLIQKAELIDYSKVSGCYILRPRAYFIWEEIKKFFDQLIKEDGVENCYFPMLIPESLLKKEEDHVEGFAPEVAWVETGGSSKLKERLAIRPTSETIMYDSYSKWIRSHKDLPLRLNQWANIVRWEFKHCTPFLRSREFLWQEGHTVFANKKEAVAEVNKILNFYEKVFKELFAVPVMSGEKSEAEKFAGADFTLSIEAFLPDGKAIQGGTSHHLGQNFAKAFGIKFRGKDGKESWAFQNSWGISTRSIGVMLLMHSDDKGLVLPPRVAKEQVVIVPLLFKNKEKKVLAAAEKLRKQLIKSKIRVIVDDREGYSPGYKYNDWELKGTPIRIEIGPRDLENSKAVLVRRDKGIKEDVKLTELVKKVSLELEKMQEDLYNKANKFLKKSIVKCETINEAKIAISEKKMALVPWCCEVKCEEKAKEKLGPGTQSLNSPFKQNNLKGKKCFACKKAANKVFYFGKSY